MTSLIENLNSVRKQINNDKVTIVAVSKTHPVTKIADLYEAGQRDFGENKVQELLDKKEELPQDIKWHLIGHLQSNKVKYIAPFVYLIHSVDSLKLLCEIDKQAAKYGRVQDCLLQVYIANEESKFGLDKDEVHQLLNSEEYKNLSNTNIRGLMGMATNTENQNQIIAEFKGLKTFFDDLKIGFFAQKEDFNVLSMGMSSDYLLAVHEGSNLVRVGSIIFGSRDRA